MLRRSNKNTHTYTISGARGGRHAGSDFNRAFSNMSVARASPLTIQVPPLPSFGSDGRTGVSGVKIGEAVPPVASIPTNYHCTSSYLEAMQAHTQQEFGAFLQSSASMADLLDGNGWLTVTCKTQSRSGKLRFLVNGRSTMHNSVEGKGSHNFKLEPWSSHAIQFEGNTVPCLATVCKDGPTDYHTCLEVVPARGVGDGGVPTLPLSLNTRVRSLGYVGSYLREYGSAAKLLRGGASTSLLSAVAAPSQHRQGPQTFGGTFVRPKSAGSLDTSQVPLNPNQKKAVMNLTGGLDIIVGPPGTGKSTTIWHIINSRVAPDARVLVTCTRNQAIDAVTQKVASFGVLVFGSETRMGDSAKKHTIEGRMCNDPELVYWRKIHSSWAKALRNTKDAVNCSYRAFPGIQKLRALDQQGNDAATGDSSVCKAVQKRGRAAGRWVRILTSVLCDPLYTERLENGSRDQRQPLRPIRVLNKWKMFLSAGHQRAYLLLSRLEALTLFRILTKTRVFISTVDSTERMFRTMGEETRAAANAVGSPRLSWEPMTLDTAIMDEAACVLETALPVILALGVSNLTLVGDQHQLQPFSHVRDGEVGYHTRSLMERALDGGAPSQFLTDQYRMHPRICSLISAAFYDDKLITSDETKSVRVSPRPCKWIHVSGGEVQHKNKGYSNPPEVKKVVEEARSALRRYGPYADVRVITFYNMQKNDLEREFKCHGDLSHVCIASVDSCQGSDADVVIISTVRSGGRYLSGFMLDRRRVNVAFSRAKEECIVVGDEDTLRFGGGSMWRSVVRHFTS